MAISANMGHQSRQVANLTQRIFSPLSAPPDPNDADEASELITNLHRVMPHPSPAALSSLHAMRNGASDLAVSLSQLGDSLQVMRQTSNLAARRLRSATEAVYHIRQELEQAELAKRWIEQSACDQKIKVRSAAQTCREVVDGFDALCDKWRERLLLGAQDDNVNDAERLDGAATA